MNDDPYTREGVVALIERLVQELHGPESRSWENTTADDYLDALGACLSSAAGYYRNNFTVTSLKTRGESCTTLWRQRALMNELHRYWFRFDAPNVRSLDRHHVLGDMGVPTARALCFRQGFA
jgi:hypothetical protein